jgi:hypothetical protein
LKKHLAVIAFYFGIAILITFPLVTVIGERLIGHPFGDTYEYTHHIWWINHALRTGQSPFFQPLLLYPDGLDAAWLWSAPLQSFPAWLLMFVVPLPIAHNLSALLTLALNGWSMWFLSTQLLAISHSEIEPPRRKGCQEEYSSLITHHSSPIPALIAGLIFMLYPTFQGQLAAGHTGLLVLYPMPLDVAMLLRLVGNLTPASHPSSPSLHVVERGLGGEVTKIILSAAILFTMSLWGNLLVLIYLLAPLTALFMLYLLWRRAWKSLLHLFLALGLGAALSLPFLLPVLREQTSQPLELREDGAVRYSASLLGIVSPSFYHPLFSGLEYPHRVLGIDPFEGASYVGIVAAALCLIALWKVRHARKWLALAVLAWVFSLGPLLKLYDQPLAVRVADYPTYVTLPWALFQNLPVLNIARTPARFNFAVAFAVAVMAGYGASHLRRVLRAVVLRYVVMAGAVVFIVHEYQFFWAMPTIPATIPQQVMDLREREDVRAVFDVPWEHLLTDKDGMYLQTGHGLPMIAGHITRRTPLNPAIGFLLQRTLDPALLDMAGADVIILHREWADSEGELDASLRERLGTPFYEDDRIAVFNVPPYTGNPPEFISSIELPDEIEGQVSLYFYAPNPGTVILTGQVASDSPRDAILSLDSTPILEWTVQGVIGLNVPIEIESAGYHTLTLAADPPCPTISDPSLECVTLRVSGVELVGYTPLFTN